MNVSAIVVVFLLLATMVLVVAALVVLAAIGGPGSADRAIGALAAAVRGLFTLLRP